MDSKVQEVKTLIENWRRNRKSIQERMPEEIRQKVIALSATVRRRQLTQEFKLHGGFWSLVDNRKNSHAVTKSKYKSKPNTDFQNYNNCPKLLEQKRLEHPSFIKLISEEGKESSEVTIKFKSGLIIEVRD